MSQALCDLPAHRIVAGVKRGDFSAAEVLESTLARIEAVEGRPPGLEGEPADGIGVHAFISLTPERARTQAQAVDQALSRGEDPGPLAGVPLAVKDIFCLAGTPSTAGSRILRNFVAPYSATPAARLERAGAVTVGKTNLDEFTFGSSNESSAFQPSPRNPWDPTRPAPSASRPPSAGWWG